MIRKLYPVIAFLLFLLLSSCANKPQEKPTELPTDMEDLRGNSIAVITGGLYEIMLSQDSEYKLLKVNSIPESLTALENGLVDYEVEDDAILYGINLEERGLAIAFRSDYLKGDFGAAFRKDNAELLDSFNAYLDSLKECGALDEIRSRWLRYDAQASDMPEYAAQTSGKPIKVGIVPNFPFTYISNEKWVGYEPEILNGFSQYVNRPVEFKTFDFGALSAALMTGKIDALMACMTITEERAKTLNFSHPYHTTRTVCLYKQTDANNTDNRSFFEKCKDSFHNNLITEKRWKLILQGLWETIVISVFAILIGTLFGALMCWMRMSRSKFLQFISKLILELMRGIPLLVFLMIMFYVVFATSGLTARWVAIIAFALNFGAYVSEMFRTSIEGVDKGQTEAGLAMGYTPFKTFKKFVLPEALSKAIPVYKGEAVSLVKNTSIVGYIAIQDLTKVSDIIRSRTFDAFFTLIVISIIYFILAWLIGKFLDRITKKI